MVPHLWPFRASIPLLLLAFLLIAALATYGIVSSQPANGVYDTDGDGLIEISTLEQLDAVRHDTDGNGRVDNELSEAYHSAFSVEDGERVCKQGCNGYELTRSLDFDKAGSYAAEKINTKWTTGNGWLPIGISEDRFRATFDGNGHTIKQPFHRPHFASWRDRSASGCSDIHIVSTIFRNMGLVDVDVTGKRIMSADWLAAIAACNRLQPTSTGSVSGKSGPSAALTGGKRRPDRLQLLRGQTCRGSITVVGGLTGWNWGSGAVIASYATGDVSEEISEDGRAGRAPTARATARSSSATPSVKSRGNNTFGGLVGMTRRRRHVARLSTACGTPGARNRRIGVGEGDSSRCNGEDHPRTPIAHGLHRHLRELEHRPGQRGQGF